MFINLYIKKLKILLKRKSMLFWTLAFPFVLGTFFQVALGNLGNSAKLEIIDIAVVDNDEYQNDETLKGIISSLSEEGENQLFNTKYVSKDEAEKLLSKEDISGYIIIKDNNPELVIKANGLNETIIKYALDQYYQMTNVATQMIEYNPEVVYNGALQLLQENPEYIKDNSTEKLNFSLNYFLTLIAMACLYGSLIGLEIIKDSEANLSAKGARVCISPVNKLKIIISGVLAGYTIQLIAIALLYVYLIFGFNIDFGPNILEMGIITAVGCLAGISMGTFVGVCNKKSEGFKTGLLIGVTMFLCFFAGMMGSPSTKATLDDALPWFRVINPVHIISDGLYALYAYDTLNVYYSCLIRLSIFAVLMIALTFIYARRKNYDSI